MFSTTSDQAPFGHGIASRWQRRNGTSDLSPTLAKAHQPGAAEKG
jgi:hypothetical protein